MSPHTTIVLPRPSWPRAISTIPDPPRAFHARGNLSLLEPEILSQAIAVVGARRATPDGLRASMHLSMAVARAGCVVVSGLALGVDGIAHEAALQAKVPTIAVLGHGLDRIYPRQNASLAERILDSGGLLVSEYADGVGIEKYHFPQRNRILSALARATVVIEASATSGSLTTARHALDQGREVFVVPGPFDHPSYAGSHRLVRDGARLVVSAENLIEDLALGVLNPAKATELGGVWDCVRRLGPVSIDTLWKHTNRPLVEVLGELERGIAEHRILESAPQIYLWIA